MNSSPTLKISKRYINQEPETEMNSMIFTSETRACQDPRWCYSWQKIRVVGKKKKSNRASFSIVGKIRLSLRSIKGSLRRLHGRGGIAPSWPFVQVFQGNISSNYIFIMVWSLGYNSINPALLRPFFRASHQKYKTKQTQQTKQIQLAQLRRPRLIYKHKYRLQY